MTEVEAVELLSDVADTASSYLSIFFTLTFAYLTAAYFVGAALSRLQNFLVSGVYLLAVLLFGLTAAGWANVWVIFYSRERTAMDDVWLFSKTGDWIYVGLYVTLASIASASVYFMYDVRKRVQIPNQPRADNDGSAAE